MNTNTMSMAKSAAALKKLGQLKTEVKQENSLLTKASAVSTEKNTLNDNKVIQNSPDIAKKEAETFALFEKVLSNQEVKRGNNDAKRLIELSTDIIKNKYDENIAAFQNEYKDIDRNSLIDKYHVQLNQIALQEGVIDKIDERSAKLKLAEQTYEDSFQKTKVIDGIKRGLYNQVEGIEYGAYFAQALLSGDKSKYTEKSGMSEDSSWMDVAIDALFPGNTGSKTGGKFLAADLLFLIPGVGTLSRFALKGIGTSVVKATGKTIIKQAGKEVVKEAGETLLKGSLKNAEKAVVEDLIKQGATIELKGIGAKMTDKYITKLAKEAANKEVKELGLKKVSSVPSELLAKKKAEIIMNGLNTSQKIEFGLKQGLLFGADLMNVPYALNAREMVKGFIAYGAPVTAGVSETGMKATEWLTQTGNKFTQLYAQNNVTKYETQLAEKFMTETGIDPLKEGSGIEQEWQAYKNYMIKNQGMSTIIGGEKEGWGKFGNFFLDTLVNMGGMIAGTKIGTTAISSAGSKFQISGTADLTKKIDEIYRNNKDLDIELRKTESQLQEEISKIEVGKGNVVEDIKLVNRVEDIVNGILNKSASLINTDAKTQADIEKLSSLLKKKNIPADKMPAHLEKISTLSKTLVGSIADARDNFSIKRQTAELTKISEHFNEISKNESMAVGLRMSVVKNFAKGSSEMVRGVLGGTSAAELFTSKYPYMVDYITTKALSTNEMAKNIANQKILDIKKSAVLSDLVKINDNAIENGALLPKIHNAVSGLVDRNFSGLDFEVSKTMKDAIILEGTTKVLDVYNVISSMDYKTLDSDILSSTGTIDFSSMTKKILNESFGFDVINAMSKNSGNQTIKDFIDSIDKNTDIKPELKRVFENDDNIFKKDSATYKAYQVEYDTMSKQIREKLRDLSETQINLNHELNQKLMENKLLKEKLKQIESLGVETPRLENGFVVYKGNTESNINTPLKKVQKEITTNSANLVPDLQKNDLLLDIIFDDDKIKKINTENFKQLMDEQTKVQNELLDNIDSVRDSIVGIYDNLDLNRNMKRVLDDSIDPEKENDFEYSSSEALTSKYLEELSDEASMKQSSINDMILGKRTSIQDISKMSKILNQNMLLFARNGELDKTITMSNDAKAQLKAIEDKLARTENLNEIATAEKELLGILLSETQKELNQKDISEARKNVLKNRSDRYRAAAENIEVNESLLKNFGEENTLPQVKEWLKTEAEIIDKNLNEIDSLYKETNQLIEKQIIENSKEKNTEETIAKLQKDKEIYQQEIISLKEEQIRITEELYKNPFGKDNLVKLAKESANAELFYRSLADRWKKTFNENILEKYVDVNDSNNKAIFNALQQTSYEQNGKPRTKVVFKVKETKLKDGTFKYSFEDKLTTDPRLINGAKLPSEKINSEMDVIANEKGYDIIELANIELNGSNSDLSSLIFSKLDDVDFIDKMEKLDIKLSTQQDKVLYALAESIGGKTAIAPLTNNAEISNSLGSNDVTISGKKFIPNKSLYSKYGEGSQATLDNPAKVSGAITNFIYKEILTPIKESMEKRDLVLLGSIDELGKRLFFTTKKTNESSNDVFNTFYKEVMSLNEGFDPKKIKRNKVTGASEIHVNKNDYKKYVESNELKNRIDENGNAYYNAYYIDDSKANIEIEFNGEKRKVNSLNGELFMLPKSMEFVASQTGNKVDDIAQKGSIYHSGQKSFVGKGLTKKLSQEDLNQDIFSDMRKDLKAETIDDVYKQVDFILTGETLKKLNIEDVKPGTIIKIPINEYRVKKVNQVLKDKVSFVTQNITVFSRNIASDKEFSKIFDEGIKDILKVQNKKLKEFNKILKKINIDPTSVVSILSESKFGKEIASDPYMSKVITDIGRGMGYTTKTKAMLSNAMMNIFKNNIMKLQLKGSDTYLFGATDYNKLNDRVLSLNGKGNYSGIKDDNYIILDKKHWGDKVIKAEDGTYEVMTYRFPVNNPMNTRFNKVVWAEDVKDITGDIGKNAISNMHDVFFFKEGDFDGDKVYISYDEAISKGFRKMVNRAQEIDDFKITMDVNSGDKIKINDIFFEGFESKTFGVKESEKKQLRKAYDIEKKYFKDLFKVKSKYEKFSIGSLASHIEETRQKISEKMLQKGNSFGNSYIEKFYMLDGWEGFKEPETSIKSEQDGTEFASRKISENIKNDITKNDIVSDFDLLNKSFTDKISIVRQEIYNLDRKEVGLEIKNVKFDGEKITGIDKLKESINYYERVKEKLLNDFNKNRPIWKKGGDWAKYQIKLSEYKAKANNIYLMLDPIINNKKERLGYLTNTRNLLIREFEQKATESLVPRLKNLKNRNPELANDIQRHILSKQWGYATEFGTSLSENKAFFLVDENIHKEYRTFYNSKFSASNLENKFGIKFTENDVDFLAEKDKELRKVDIDPDQRDLIKDEIDSFIFDKISDARVSDKKLNKNDVLSLGSIGQTINETIFKSIEAKTNKPVKNSIFSYNDIYEIKDNFNNLINNFSEGNRDWINQGNEKALKVQINKLNESIYKKSKKGLPVAEEKAKLNKNIAALSLIEYVNKELYAAANNATRDATLKQDLIDPKMIDESDKEVKSLEYRLNNVDSNKKDLENKQIGLDVTDTLIKDNQKVVTEEAPNLYKIFDEQALEDRMTSIENKIKDNYKKAMVSLYADSSKKIFKDDSSKLLRQYDYANELNKLSADANREIMKMESMEPRDFLSNLFTTFTKIYKNTSVGIAAGRAAIEYCNTGLIRLTKAMEVAYSNNLKDSDFKSIKKPDGTPILNFKMPEPGKYEGKLFQDFGMSKTADNATGIKMIDYFARVTSDIAGRISEKFINKKPKEHAQAYYEMTFKQKLMEQVRGNAKKNIWAKEFLLSDPSKMSWQNRRKYNETMNYLQLQAKKETEKAFFNYDMNPLIAHKLEGALPFTNFLFSGVKLLANHPKSILGANVIFSGLVNNFGDQVGFVMDDEDGNPLRIDYGKRIRLGFLPGYPGFRMDFSRFLQFSPTEMGVGLTPILSFLSGDADWRIKKYIDGEMSGLELSLTTLSPSISSLATGILENDYQKKWSAMSYLLTGMPSKSTAHQDIAKSYWFDEDYEKVLKYPQAVREHLYETIAKNSVEKDIKITDKDIKGLIKAKELGLIGESERSLLDPNYKDQAFNQAIRLYNKMLAVGSDGKKQLTEDEIVTESKMGYEFMKHVVGSSFFDKMDDDDWMKKVEEFVDAGYLDSMKKTNPALGKAFEHYYNNKDYYSTKYNAYDILGKESTATQEEKLKARATLLALNYDIYGAGLSFEEKVNNLINGSVQFVLDETGRPEMTKERLSEIEYKGFYVKSYEDAIARNQLYKDLRQVQLDIYFTNKDKDKALAKQAYDQSEVYLRLSQEAFKELKEFHSDEAEIYALKNKDSKTIADGVKVTEPITGYMKERSATLNEFYNEIANDRLKFLDSNDLKWNSMPNSEKAIFRSLNNGLTFNKAKEAAQLEKDYWMNLYDSEVPVKSNNTINLINSLFE